MSKKKEIEYTGIYGRIRKDVEKLEKLELLSTSVRSPSLSGMPHGSGVTSSVEMYSVEIVDLERKIAKEYGEFFDQIPEERLRMIFMMRCMGGYGWKEVAARIGGNATAGSVRKAYSRYLKSLEVCNGNEENA